MGATASHHKNLTSTEGSSSLDQVPAANQAQNQAPTKENPRSQKQRRKTFSSLGIRGSFDFRGGSFDVGSSKADQCSPVMEEQKPPDLTAREKELLTDTWKELEENIAKVGVITFVRLFETHPDVQQSFMNFSGVDIEDLKHSKQLRAHALRVMAFVQKAVARLHEPEKLETLLRDLGRKHVGYGAKLKYVELVGPQFILAIKPSLENHWDDELHGAWTHLFKIIEFVMVSSMEEEQKRIKASKD